MWVDQSLPGPITSAAFGTMQITAIMLEQFMVSHTSKVRKTYKTPLTTPLMKQLSSTNHVSTVHG